jgi:isochorismate synthase EntC
VTTAALQPRGRAPQAVPAPAAAALAAGLERAVRFPDEALVRLAVPAPVAPAATLLRGDPDAVVWEDRDGAEAWAGLGRAAVLTARGPERFAAIAAAAAALDRRTVAIDAPPPARWLGGFAFTPGGAAGGAWAGFGDARFVLPRWTYARVGERAELILCAPARELADAAAIHAELATTLALLATPCPAPSAPRLAQRDATPDAWRAIVLAATAAIAAGALRKVVAARARVIELAQPIDAAGLVAELGRRQPACTRFGFAAGGAIFVGASPERLVRKRGRALDTEALAGSCARTDADDADAAAAALAASAKDRARARVGGGGDRRPRSAPRCARAAIVPVTPAVRTLRQILVHLHTPMVGRAGSRPGPRARAGGGAAPDAGGRRHAHRRRGGVDRRRTSRRARGWYAAPVGWFDAAGDGEFAVAIRSGLLAGATVDACSPAPAWSSRVGSGQPSWHETEVKLRGAVRRAGVGDAAVTTAAIQTAWADADRRQRWPTRA